MSRHLVPIALASLALLALPGKGIAQPTTPAAPSPPAGALPANATTEIAPGLSRAAAHRLASDELRGLVAKLTPEQQKKIVGIYAAFDTTMTDASAMAACDDDGDYVVVASDALLGLADFVAQAQATDETFGTKKLEQYATLLIGSQETGARILPPPPGFFEAPQAKNAQKVDLENARFREAVAFVMAHELEAIVQGDITCPNPTPTHEHGDDEWTREEKDHAVAVASKVYTSPRVLAADGVGTSLLLDAGRTEEGGIALLTVFDGVERAAAVIGAKGLAASTYLKLHPGSDVRAQVVRAAANQWRRLHAAGVSSAPAPR